MSLRVIVIKIGTNALLHGGELPDAGLIARLAAGVSALQKAGFSVLLVSSGAVATGRAAWKTHRGEATLRSTSKMQQHQLLSAMGQPAMFGAWEAALAKHQIAAAQALVTRSDFSNRSRHLAMQQIFEQALQNRIVPIINENDFLSPEELDFSDNDQLTSFLGGMLRAELVVLMTNVRGLLDASNQLVPEVAEVTNETLALVRAERSTHGLGGMRSKLLAAKTLAKLGVETLLCAAAEDGVLENIAHQNAAPQAGTRFLPCRKTRIKSGMRVFLASGAAARGSLVVDAPFAKLLAADQGGRSVLPVGVVEVIGNFEEGDPLDICEPKQKSCIARGIARLSAGDMRAALANAAQKNAENSTEKAAVFVHASTVFVV